MYLTQFKVKPRYYLTRFDVNRIAAWDKAENLKISAFGKLKIFNKPHPEDIICTEFKKYFDPYLVIEGVRKIARRPTNNQNPQVDGDSKGFLEEKVILHLDKTGRIVDKGFGDITELSKTFYEEHRDEFLQLEISLEKAAEIFKGHFAGKERRGASSVNQLPIVSEINVVFVSVYLVKYEWRKVGATKIIKIAGHTGKCDVYNL